MYTIEKFKRKTNLLELQVITKVNDLSEMNISPISFPDRFKEEMKKIKKTNCFEAEYSYKAEKTAEKTIEIWKMKADGDKNYLMFKLTKGKDQPGPFDHW